MQEVLLVVSLAVLIESDWEHMARAAMRKRRVSRNKTQVKSTVL
jgi:hypothetical protein